MGKDKRIIELKADGVPIWSGGNLPAISEAVSYRLSPTLNAGAAVTLQAKGIDTAGNEGTATATISITQAAMGPGYLQGKVLEDNRGLKLEGVEVSITHQLTNSTNSLNSGTDGGYFLETPAGSALVRVAKPGYTTVERTVQVIPEKNITVLDARLTKISDTINVIDAAGETAKASPFIIHNSPFIIELTVPAGALGSSQDLRLTPISNQGLAGILPLGWSPLAAVDIRSFDPLAGTVLDTTFTSAATVKLPLPASVTIDPAAPPMLARYDEPAHQWLAVGTVSIDSASPLQPSAFGPINTAGQYALVLADTTNAPPAAVAGAPLAAATAVSLDYVTVTTTGKVVPQAAPPSAGLKAAGEVVLTAKDGAAPIFTSGLILGSRITEKFDLKSGDAVEPPVSTQDIILYRYPCITSIGAGAVSELPFDSAQGPVLRTTFPVSPSKDYTIVDLLLGKVGIEIVKPDTSETGVMVGVDGGRLVDADGNILNVAQGALAQTTPVSTKTAAAANGAVGSDFTLIRAVEVNLTRQTLAIPATISIPAPAGLDGSLPLVVAKQIDVKGVAKLKLIALARQSGTLISSEPLTQPFTNSTTQLNSSGIYYFLQAKAPLGFITGAVTDSGSAPFTGALVKTDSGSLVDLASSNGRYLLAAPVAPFTITALDLYKNDEVSANSAITAANQIVNLDLKIEKIPPTVVSVSPANGAVKVQPDVPVVVTFSKAMDKTTITSSTLVVRDAANSEIAGALTFSIDSKTVTFYPAEAFKQETGYSVTIAASVKDLQGYQLGQDVTSTFTIRRTTPPVMPAAGSISGTFPDADGFITITATQGSANPNDTVLLINDTTGEITSVTPQSNGSFNGKVRGQLGDEIKVVLMDYSGNQTTVSYITFKNTDGSYLVTAKGGKVEGEGGSILDIPEGALVGPAIIKVTAVREANLPSPLQAPGQYLAAFNIDSGGIPFKSEVKLSIPLPPGFDPATPVFVTRPAEVFNDDGTVEKVYEIIDSTKVENGRITTASPPFDGVMGFGSYAFTAFPTVTVGIVSGYTYQEMNTQSGYQATPAGVTDPVITSDTVTYNYDKPIQGAIIRTPAAWNYVSYSNSRGFYAGMTTLYGNVGAADLEYKVTAIHPLTMQRQTITGYLNAIGNIKNLNFKLADKTTIAPDKTPPVINMNLSVAPGQPPANRLAMGIMPPETALNLSMAVNDQSLVTATLVVNYRSTDDSLTPFAIPLTLTGKTLVTPQTAEKPAIWQFLYKAQFPLQLSSSQTLFKPTLPGSYISTLEALDEKGNRSSKTLQVRVVSAESIPGSVDGSPEVLLVTPVDGEANLVNNVVVDAWFSEPVENVTPFTFFLEDTTTGLPVSADINSAFDGGMMKATLTPRNNLAFDRKYKIVITADIMDTSPNPSFGNSTLRLRSGFTGSFTTKRPAAYSLEEIDQFKGARDIAYYRGSNGNSYTYVAAGDQGWRVVDVTNPKAPKTAFSVWPGCDSAPDSKCRTSPNIASYRGIAVHPDSSRELLAITDNYFWPDGNHYGYLRFYDLSASETEPTIIGRERLAEAYSGIPGRVAMWGDYAYVATANAALQVVDINAAIEYAKTGEMTDGSSIVGAYDSIGSGYGSPNDIFVYAPGKALLTTNPGHLLVLDVNNPLPVLSSAIAPSSLGATRVTAVADYGYDDINGNRQSIDLAVTAGFGKLKTVDLSDPYNPKVLATVKDASGLNDAASYAYDIVIDKERGIAVASSLSSIQIIDIRNPGYPRVINTINQLPDAAAVTDASGAPAMITLGGVQAVTLDNGWLYLAEQNKGVLTINIGGKEKLQCSPNCDCCGK